MKSLGYFFFYWIVAVFAMVSCSENDRGEKGFGDTAITQTTYLLRSDKDTITGIDPLYFSQDLLYAIRAEEAYDEYMDTLASLNASYLKEQLKIEPEKKAFWLNIYNALVQHLLETDSATYKNDMKAFFKERKLTVCARLLSLDDIEHGILRGKEIKGELGQFVALFMLDSLDARVHFTLNCGGGSCPPIAFYKPDQINAQLEEACEVYLKAESRYDEATNTVYTSAIMDWYSEDFGGTEGVLALLGKKGIYPPGRSPKLAFTEFDWALKSRKF